MLAWRDHDLARYRVYQHPGRFRQPGSAARGLFQFPARRLPILGLSDIVIFPGMVAPLLVETAQSTKLIDDVVGGDRLLGVALQRNAEAENPLPHEMHEVGCAARVLKMLKFPDNTVRVLVEGLWRIRIREYTTTEPYLCAKFELLQDVNEDSVELTAMMRNAQSQFQEIIKLSPALSEQIKIAALNTEDPGHFADLIAVNLNLDPGRAPEAARNHFRQRAPDPAAADAQSRARSADPQLEDSDRGRHLHLEDPARFLSPRANARHPARTGRDRPQRRRDPHAARENRANRPCPPRPKQVATQEVGPPAADASGRRRIRP